MWEMPCEAAEGSRQAMVSFARELAAFSRGEISRDELLSSVEVTVAAQGEDYGSLLAALDEDTRIATLPNDLRGAIEERIQATLTTGRHRRGGAANDVSTAGGTASTIPTGLPADDTTRILPASGRDVGVGDTIKGRFVLEQQLGSGGMGTVFKALDRRRLEAQDRQAYVAVKVLSKAFRQHPTSFMALQREAKKALSLAHPNIVRVYDFDRDGATIFMTMEYLSGKSLENIIKARDFAGLPLKQVLEIIAPIGSALAYAHKSGIVHSDFKPSNVFLTGDGQVKVIDFGIARAIRRGDEPEGDHTAFDVGSLGALTPAYASPEMAEGLDPDPRDDIYALACVTCELLSGQHPFRRMPAIAARAQKRAPALPAGLKRAQVAALQNALALDRNKRTPAVEPFLAGLDERPPGWRRPRAVAAAALVAVLAGGVGYQATRPSGPETARPGGPPVESALQPPPGEEAARPAGAAAAVEAAVAAGPCSLLTATVEERAVVVVGYARDPADITQLRRNLDKVAGGREASVNVLRWIDAPLCAPIELFKPLFLANIRRDVGLKVHLQHGTEGVQDGQPIVAVVDSPAYDSYVYVDLFANDGTVTHLVPRRGDEGNWFPARTTVTIDDSIGTSAQRPIGTQLVVVYSVTQPLFERPRAQQESAQLYLGAVHTAFELAAARAGAAVPLADFDFVKTEPRI